MDVEYCLRCSNSSLAKARQYLRTEDNIYDVCDEIQLAMLWSMEYWLRTNGHEPDVRKGWHSMHKQFFELTKGLPVYELSRCASSAARLDACLHGWEYEEGDDEDWDIEVWKRNVEKCLTAAEQQVMALEQ